MFETTWICILTSGATIDGREIKPETLQEMVDTYNPKKYNARINIDHNPHGVKLGSVLALKVKAGNEDGQKKLYAKLKPNDWLLYLVQKGQKLHTSCEIVHNFAKTGQAYLVGLAVTDNPASLGTTEMHLSADSNKAEVFSTSEAIDYQPHNKSALSKLNNFLTPEEDNIMDKAALEQLKQIQEQQGQMLSSLNDLSDTVAKLSDDRQKPEQTVPPVNTSETQEQVELKALQEQITKLTQTVENTQATIQQLSTETDQAHRVENTGQEAQNKEMVVL